LTVTIEGNRLRGHATAVTCTLIMQSFDTAIAKISWLTSKLMVRI